jgi:integrase
MSNNYFASVFASVGMTESNNNYPYELARLVDCGGDLSKRWYVIFYVWDANTDQKERKRIYSINDFPTEKGRRKAADHLISIINKKLESGWIIPKKAPKKAESKKLNIDSLTLKDAYLHFLSVHKSSIAGSTYGNYITTQNTLFGWLDKNEIGGLLFKDFTTDVCFDFFDHLKVDRSVGNKTYNNYLGDLKAFFNFYKKRKIIIESALEDVSKKRTQSGKHIPFTNDQFKAIREKCIEVSEHHLLLFVRFIYFTFGRPSEVRMLRVRDIKTNTIFYRAEDAKNDKGQHVQIPLALEDQIIAHKLREYPPHYYIFSILGEPGEQPVGANYMYKHHKKVLDSLKMSDQDYTLYGHKHTGVINLFFAGADIKQIQMQCRHSNIAQTDKYLRDLGLLRKSNTILNFSE